MSLLRRSALLAVACAAVGWAQAPITCSATVQSPGLRATGVTELVGVLVTCNNPNTYPQASTLPFATLTLTSNAVITTNVTAIDSNSNTWTEALLIRDDAAPAQQFFCAGGCVGRAATPFNSDNPSVFQARRISSNVLEWSGIPLDAGTHTFRLENVRVDTTSLSAAAVTFTLGATGVTLTQPVLSVGAPATPIAGSVLNAAKTSTGVVTIVTDSTVTNARVGTLRVAELFANALRRRSLATPSSVDSSPAFVAQSTPGVPYTTESGFTNPNLPSLQDRGSLNATSVAASGTRVRAVFTGIPAGVTLAVAPASDNATLARVARLITTTNGTGAAFNAAPTGTSVVLTPSGGTAVAVWEILNADPATLDTFDLGLYASYSSGTSSGVVSVRLTLEPIAPPDSFLPTPSFGQTALADLPALSFLAPSALMSCSLTANALPIRQGGQTELTASGLLTCAGGFPFQGTLPAANFNLSFSHPSGTPVRITSRTLGSVTGDGVTNWTEALLLIDDPAASSQYPCLAANGVCSGFGNGSGQGANYYGNGTGQNRNVYQSYLNSDTQLVFPAIPLDAAPFGGAALSVRRYRFENLRIDTSALAPGAITLNVSVNGAPETFRLVNNSVTIANVNAAGLAQVFDAAGVVPQPSGVEVDATTAQSTPQRLATLRMREVFGTHFKTRTTGLNGAAAPQAQSTPGATYTNESGFYNPALGSAGARGNLGLAGLADHGLRVWLRFSNVPAGVQLFVNSVNDESLTSARLVSTDATGSGPFLAGANGVVPVPLIGGAGAAAYEFLRTDVELIENASFGIYLTTAAGVNQTTPIRVDAVLAPFAPSADIPRFIPNLGSLNLALFTFKARPVEPEQVSLVVNPSSMLFTVFEGQTAAPQVLSAASSNPNIPLDVIIEGPGSFPNTITPSSGRTNLNASVQASAGTLPPGRYDGLIRVSSGRAINSPVLVPVTLIVQRNFVLLSITPEVVQAGGPGFKLTGVGRFVPPGSSLAWNGEILNTTGGGDTLIGDIPARLYAQPGRALITIRAPDGRTSNALPIEIVPRVFITRLDPERVTATRSGFNLVVTGGGYVAASQVRFGGETLGPQSGSETRLVVPLSTAQLAQPRTVPVQVLNPFNIVSNIVDFVIDPVPVITSVDPPVISPGVPVQPVRVRGRNFRSDHALRVGGGGSGNAVFVSSEEFLLTLAAPAVPGVYPLTVVTSDGVSSNSASLSVATPAVIVNPVFTNGDSGGPVNIDGAGFVTGTTIQIISTCQPMVTVTPTSITPTRITFTMPPAPLTCTGPVQIVIVPPPGNPAPPPIIITVNPAPRVESITPGNLVVGATGVTLIVTGSGLPAGSTILVNGSPIPSTFVNGQQITGTPPASFFSAPGTLRIQVQGPGGAVSNTFTITVVLPPLPDATFEQVPGTANLRQTVTGRVRLANAFPADVTVELLLTFSPDGNLPDDPLIRFANGSRSFTTVLRAGADPLVPFALETGSTAGVITITVRLTPAGGALTAGPSIRITIARRAPELTALECRRDAAARTLTIVADGISNPRDIRQGNFQFQASSGANVPTTQFTLDLASLFNTWFASAASQALGGVFRYTQSFTIQGDPAAVTGVSLTLVNSIGTSNAQNADCR